MERKPQSQEESKFVKGLKKHGVIIGETNESSNQVICDCPWCGAEDKFYLNYQTGMWDCKVCLESGNYEKFFELVVKRNEKHLLGAAAIELSKNRSISVKTFKRWHVGFDGKFYTVPLYGQMTNAGRLIVSDVKTFRPGTKSMSSPGSRAGMILVPEENDLTDTIWLCEGEWDTMCWWEILRSLGVDDTVMGLSGNGSLPVKSKIIQLFRGKKIILLFDHDKAGWNAIKRTYKILAQLAREIVWIEWPGSYPDKYDVRDLVIDNGRSPQKIHALIESFLQQGDPNLTEEQRIVATVAQTGPNAQLGAVQAEENMTGEGMSAEDAIEEYKKWLFLEDEHVLDVMFGSVFANRLNSDPFWLFLVAPPSGSKSELLMTLTNAPKIYTITSVTPHALVSGSFGAGGDPSLIPELLGKTLVIKDFTTILTQNQTNRDEIFGILRDAYDGKIEKKFGNSVHRRYEGKFGIIAGVTPAIEQYSTTNLGERFLKYRIKRFGGVDTGREIIMRAMRNIGHEDSMRHGLQEISGKVLNRPVLPEHMPDVTNHYEQTMRLAQWTAVMRGQVMRERYTQSVMYKPEHETGARLAKQFLTFGMGVGVFRNEKVMSDRTFGVMKQLARSTVPDRAEEALKRIYQYAGEGFAKLEDISMWTRLPRETCRPICQDLELLHVLERNKGPQGYWRISDKVYELTELLKMYRKSAKKKLTPLVKKGD